jgi:ComF family protein
LFWGRAQIEFATAFLQYTKKGAVQKLLYALKYSGATEIGLRLGIMMGREMGKTSRLPKIDMIVPVPLHKRKLSSRGYNQSSFIASGLAESLGIEVLEQVLVRSQKTPTQTKKNRFERWVNVSEGFKIHDVSVFRNKHILIVDDVVTTGATMESCCHQILKVEGARVSIAALAFPMN